ncbi:MAG: hypothetical protein ABJF86_06715 [Tateyamaria sp.]|uniref:hypothetical protein n=1 Tax=Tateyamaria sp. TaxID=1929288 RepID=UPI0032696B9D
MSAIRTIALIFFFGPLAAMFGEPFFEEFFDLLGWDSEDWAAPAMTWVANNTPLLMGFVGLGAGVWVHFLASRLKRRMDRPPATHASDIDLNDLEIVAGENFDGKTVRIDWKCFKRCSFVNATLIYQGNPVHFSECEWPIEGDQTISFASDSPQIKNFIEMKDHISGGRKELATIIFDRNT